MPVELLRVGFRVGVVPDFDGPEIGERPAQRLELAKIISAVYEPFQPLPEPLALGGG